MTSGGSYTKQSTTFCEYEKNNTNPLLKKGTSSGKVYPV